MKNLPTELPVTDERLDETGLRTEHTPAPMSVGEQYRANRILTAMRANQYPIHRTVDPQYFEALMEFANGVQLVTPQLARMFDISVQTVMNWRNYKRLPYYHLEGGFNPPVRYDEGMVMRWAELEMRPVMYRDYKDEKWKKSGRGGAALQPKLTRKG